jgi:hypothetical protein
MHDFIKTETGWLVFWGPAPVLKPKMVAVPAANQEAWIQDWIQDVEEGLRRKDGLRRKLQADYRPELVTVA